MTNSRNFCVLTLIATLMLAVTSVPVFAAPPGQDPPPPPDDPPLSEGVSYQEASMILQIDPGRSAFDLSFFTKF